MMARCSCPECTADRTARLVAWAVVIVVAVTALVLRVAA
jgi:hypothetical protein